MRFEKVLSRNDVGSNGSHQAGFLVPKSNDELIDFLPFLDPREMNPSVYIDFYDSTGRPWRLRYVYYNNKLHGAGTRNELRITHVTGFMRNYEAVEGDVVYLTKTMSGRYLIGLDKTNDVKQREIDEGVSVLPDKIKLSGWNVVY